MKCPPVNRHGLQVDFCLPVQGAMEQAGLGKFGKKGGLLNEAGNLVYHGYSNCW